jgi:hypothetical protein
MDSTREGVDERSSAERPSPGEHPWGDSGQIVALVAWIGIFAFYDVIASYEERQLVEAYGSAYETSRSRVPKWIPRIRAARPPS